MKRQTDNIEAYQLYLRGRFEWNKFSLEGIARSIEYLNAALTVDPNYPLAYSGLADAYGLQAHIGTAPSREIYPKAKWAAEKALALDDTLAEAHAAMANVRLFYDWDFAAGKREAERAIELNPNSHDGHSAYAQYLKAKGQYPEFLATIKRAQELDPLSPINNLDVAEAFYFSRRYDDAIRQCEKTLELNPYFFLTYHVWARALEQMGQHAQAIEKYKQAIEMTGRDPHVLASLGHVYASAGQREQAHKILDELLAISRQRYLPSYLIAKIYAGLGDVDETLAWLEKGYQERYFLMTWLNGEPQFDSVRSDPRFADLLRRIGI